MEQIFKNALTGLPLGGGKGGSDFAPNGKSDAEVMRFCQSFMTELYRHIGPDVDVPAGDIGVGGREIGYLYGQYRRIKGRFENGVLTGKGLSFGGSLVRPEATGFGITYFTNEMLKANGETFEGKTVVSSGFGNVTWGTCRKVAELGGKVITLSGPDGYIYDKGDIIIPCATQNEIHMEDAKKIVANNIKFVCEGSNMPTTNEALTYLQEQGLIVGPAKAANAGGVATSGLEMSQNSMRLSWTAEEVDAKLKEIMVTIHKNCADASERFGLGYDLVAGANIAGFLRVSEAMMAQGNY